MIKGIRGVLGLHNNQDSKVIYECDYGKAEYSPHNQIETQIVNQARVYKYSQVMIVTRTEQWLKAIKELKNNSALRKSDSIYKIRDMTKKIYSTLGNCYIRMIANFEKFYETSSGKSLTTFKIKANKDKKISALLNGFYKDLINNVADGLAERLGDEEAPSTLTAEISMEVRDGQFILQ